MRQPLDLFQARICQVQLLARLSTVCLCLKNPTLRHVCFASLQNTNLCSKNISERIRQQTNENNAPVASLQRQLSRRNSQVLAVEFVAIIEKVGPWSIFSRPKNGSTSLQNSLFEHNAKSRSASKRRKNGSTSLQNSLFDSAQLCSRSYFAVTSWLLRSHFAVTTWLLRSRYGYYAVFTRLLRSLCGHYGYYAVRKSTYSRLRKRSTSLQNGLFDQNIVAVLISLLLQNGSIIPQIGFKFDSIMRKNGFNNATCLPQQ